MTKIERGNTFFQSMQNIGKLGAYYTDIQHCKRIGHLIGWPEYKEVCILEPSCGDCSALNAVTEEFPSTSNLVKFGVEMNSDTYEIVKDKKDSIDYIVNADFLSGFRASNKCFSVAFANPPYGEYEDGMRYEQAFAEKLFLYLKRDALLVYVIPYYVLSENDKFIKSFFGRYNPMGVFRFDESEYKKYKQIVLFAYRRNANGYKKEELIRFCNSISNLEDIPFLPEITDTVKKFPVIPSYENSVVEFTTKKFHPEIFSEALINSALYANFSHYASVKRYSAIEAGDPALPLTKEKAHMLAVCGAGSGLAGNEEDGTIHLQRGVVEQSSFEKIVHDEDGKSNHFSVIKQSSTSMHIIDADFNYHVLKASEKREEEV